MTERIRIISTDDHQSYRQGLVSILKEENIYAIGQAENGHELLHLLEVEMLRPDLILLDLDMPKMDGNITLANVKGKYPEMKVIILSSFSEGSLQNDFKSKGASSFLKKNTDVKIIADTIKRTHYLVDYSNIPQKIKSLFTEREVQVIPLLLAGKKSRQIADVLGVAEKTVEQYRNRLYDKTGTANGSEFSAYCAREGLNFLSKNSLNNSIE
jgi:DNA-binding NarL/FixJ family response regulator